MCTLTDESCVGEGRRGGGADIIEGANGKPISHSTFVYNVKLSHCVQKLNVISASIYHVVKLICLMVEHSGSVFLRNVDIAYIVYIICERSITGSKSNASQMHILYFLEPWFQL